jgi:hypothetical protein
METGGPCEYLHSPQAKHLSSLILFSRVQNLQDQTLNFETSFCFFVPQASHSNSNGYNKPSHQQAVAATFNSIQ